jgi:hypothetical protein
MSTHIQFQRKFRWILSLTLSAMSLFIGCHEDGLVSRVRLDIIPLHDASDQPFTLPNEGTLKVTAFSLDDGELYQPVTFNVASRTGEIPPLPLGQWRFFVEMAGGAQNFFGASGPFSIKEGEGVRVQAVVGPSGCAGLLPPQPAYVEFPGKLDVAPRVGSTASELPDGRIVILGGGRLNEFTGQFESISDEIQIYDHKYGLILTLSQRLTLPRAFHQATVLRDGRVMISGGVQSVGADGTPLPTDSVEMIQLSATGEVIVEPAPNVSLGEARYHHKALLLDDEFDSVLIVGGIGTNQSYLSSAVRYFPNENIVRPQGNLSEGKAFFSMSRFQRTREKAILTGGKTVDGVSDKIEIFSVDQSLCTTLTASPEVGCFLPGFAKLNHPRFGHSSALIDNLSKNLLIVGGFSAGSLIDPTTAVARMELLRETNGGTAFEIKDDLGSLLNPRGLSDLVPLRDGTLLYVGGRDQSGNSSPTLSVLTPDIDTTLSTLRQVNVNALNNNGCGLSEQRYFVTTSPTRDGGVLLFGGLVRGVRSDTGNVSHIASQRVELFYPRIDGVPQIIEDLP